MTKEEKAKYTHTTEDLWKELDKLAGMKIKLDCGHHVTIRPGHGFVNDFMVRQGYRVIECSLCSY
jgi:hypothetical protein